MTSFYPEAALQFIEDSLAQRPRRIHHFSFAYVLALPSPTARSTAQAAVAVAYVSNQSYLRNVEGLARGLAGEYDSVR